MLESGYWYQKVLLWSGPISMMKEIYHLADCLRYAIVALTTPKETEQVVQIPWARIG